MGDVATGLLTVFVGATGAIFIGEAAKRWFLRRLAATDLARDGLLDVLLSLRSIETVFESLMRAELTAPLTRAELVKTGSAWAISTPVLSCERLLDGLDHERAHAEAILFFDQLAALAAASADHQEAYFWLLDMPPADVTSFDREDPRTAERLDTLRITRIRMQQYAMAALWHGYEFAVLLAELGDRLLSIRFDREPIDSMLRARFDISREALGGAAAYYRNARVSRLFAGNSAYVIVDPPEQPPDARFRYCAITWPVAAGGECEVVLDRSSRYRVALPTSEKMASVRVLDAATEAWLDLPLDAVSLSESPARSPNRVLRIDASALQDDIVRRGDGETQDEVENRSAKGTETPR